MALTPVHESGRALPRGLVVAGRQLLAEKRRGLEKTNPKKMAATAAQRPIERDGAFRGGWLVNRLLCLVRGHRHLVPTAAAAKILPNGVEQEIYLCHACGSYAWKTSKRTSIPNWAELRGWSITPE
jgi:hypothetical protein